MRWLVLWTALFPALPQRCAAAALPQPAGTVVTAAGRVVALVRTPAPRDPALDRDEGAPFVVDDPLAVRVRKLLAARPALRGAERRLVVDKPRHQLEARLGDVVLQRYVVNLGFSPTGGKLRQGDGKTPEGRYRVREHHGSFFGLSYPAAADAERGLAAGLVDARTAWRLIDAERRGRLPDWSTPLGGAVGIHGGGAFRPDGDEVVVPDWTFGCIALTDRDLADLRPFLVDGIPVDIR